MNHVVNWSQFTRNSIKEMQMRYSSMRGSRGQHFLVNFQTVQNIVLKSGVKEGDHVLEIGGGLGILTAALLDKGVDITVIERDPELARHLEKTFGESINLVNGDALTVPWPENVKIVANLPYSVGTKLVTRAVHHPIQSMTVMLQEEVVNRIVAKPGSGEYGRLSFLFTLHGDVTKLFNVPPKFFVPPPRVNSSVFSFVPRDTPANHEELELLVRNLFFRRNRTVRKVLKGYLKKRIELSKLDLIPHSSLRVNLLDVEKIREIHTHLVEEGMWPLAGVTDNGI